MMRKSKHCIIDGSVSYGNYCVNILLIHNCYCLKYIHNRLGNDAFADKKYDIALTHYTNAIKIDPHNAVYYSNRR